MPKTKPISSARQDKINQRRQYKGPVFFSQGFRPLFLGAALWAILAIVLWLASWLGSPLFGLAVDANWHIHEMLFGFAPAAVCGFLLTAIPNWTGRLPVRGVLLMLLSAFWLAGRIAMLMQPILGQTVSAGIDVVFLLALSLAVFREIIAGRNWKNLKIAFILAGLTLANIWFHLETAGIVYANEYGVRAAVSLLVLLIALIGGRIIPSFTRNTLKKRGATALPAPFSNSDRFTLVATLITGISFTFIPNSLLTAALALVCSILHFERLTRWRGLHVLFEPMLWVLHLAYLWIGIGFALMASSLFLQAPTMSAAIHAFTTGAFASMILAVMTRASRGHTGRALVANLWTTAIYISISLAAILRVLGSIFAGSLYHQMASVFWVAAFGIFVIAYWPVLVGKNLRVSGK
ncbi:NnrS protein involved in response to NO [hydrothermal vent metagenome]|uniref:NnrS protein involved in response to NO n=1 Tax=hydrothermal vent metagenome TaxID=652676 RepID=A0A3B0RH73_9ZZZZ